MPFANLPSSPGFQAPQAPDWTRFAAQANEFIQRGGEMRAQAGKDFAESIDKAASQISGILQYNSPEAKAKRKMEMIQTQAMTQLYQDFQAHPDKYQMTAHGPILKDPFEQALKIAHLRQAVTGGDVNQYNLKNKKIADDLLGVHDAFRKTYSNVDPSALPESGSNPAGAPGSGSELVNPQQAADAQTNDVPTVPLTSLGLPQE